MTFYDAYIILLGKLGMSHNTWKLWKTTEALRNREKSDKIL